MRGYQVILALAAIGVICSADVLSAQQADEARQAAATAQQRVAVPTLDVNDQVDPRWVPKDAGCALDQLVSTGGPFPTKQSRLAVRWTGYSNFELAYKGHVLLLDAYINRGTTFPSLGFYATDVIRADAILIGHGHADHMSDAASIAKRTGAIVVGAPVTTDKLVEQKLPRSQIRTVTGTNGATLRFGPFTVTPILGLHGNPPSDVTRAFRDALAATTRPLTDAERETRARVSARGTNDPRVSTEGTIAYLITLDNGFSIMYRDSGGAITRYERVAMQKAGRSVDLGLIAVSSAFISDLTVAQALQHLAVYRPSAYIPAHRDAAFDGLWRPVGPLFEAARKRYPGIATIAPSYREPVCFDTSKNLSQIR